MKRKSIAPLMNIVLFFSILFLPFSAWGGTREEFFQAVTENDTEMVQQMLRTGFDVNTLNREGLSALHVSITYDLNTMTRYLLDQGIDIDLPDSDGQTPVMTAAATGNIEMCRLLISRGARLNILDKAKQSALSLAINNGQYETAWVLIEQGAILFQEEILHPVPEKVYRKILLINDQIQYIDETSAAGDLFLLTANGDFHEIRELLKNGTDPDQTDSSGLTPLHMSCSLEDAHIGELLIQYGADVRLRDSTGSDALAYVSYFGNTQLFREILRNYPPPPADSPLDEDVLFYAYCGRQPALLERLVRSGMFPLENRDERGAALIHYAAYMGDFFTVKTLLAAGVSPQLEDSQGNDILYYTVTGLEVSGENPAPYYQTAKKLLRTGVDAEPVVRLTEDRRMREILLESLRPR